MKHYFKETIFDLVGKWVHAYEGALPPLSGVQNNDTLCKSESALAFGDPLRMKICWTFGVMLDLLIASVGFIHTKH